MANANQSNDKWAELWLLIVPLSIAGCAIMWKLNNALWGILTGLVTFGLCYYHIIYKKK